MVKNHIGSGEIAALAPSIPVEVAKDNERKQETARSRAAPPSPDQAKLKRGRPTITAPRPWDSEGMSRRTWYRRRQAEKRENSK